MLSALQVLGYHFLIASIIIIHHLGRDTFFEIFFPHGIRQGTGAGSLRDQQVSAQEKGAVCWLGCSSLARGPSPGEGCEGGPAAAPPWGPALRSPLSRRSCPQPQRVPCPPRCTSPASQPKGISGPWGRSPSQTRTSCCRW